MPIQTANNVAIAFKAQSGLGVPASGSGGTGLRIKPSQGIRLTKNFINSNEIRKDGMTSRGRHGFRQAGDAYSCEMSVGSFDELIQAILRGTYVAATDITQAAMTSITTTANTIVAAAGSWLTQGVRVGDKVKLTGHSTAANNGKWFRVVDVSALVITLPTGSLTLDAGADTSFTLTIAKTVVMGATPTERYFTMEDVYQNLTTSSLVTTDLKLVKLDFNATPGEMIELNFTFMGLNATPSAAAPVLTSPTYSTTVPLVMLDGTIRIGGVDYTVLTGFQFSLDLSGANPPVIGSVTGADIFLSGAKLSGSFTAFRQNMVFMNAFSAETQVDFFLDCMENESDPRDFGMFYIGNVVLNGADTQFGADGPLVETIPWSAGKDEAGGARAATMIKYSTSAT